MTSSATPGRKPEMSVRLQDVLSSSTPGRQEASKDGVGVTRFLVRPSDGRSGGLNRGLALEAGTDVPVDLDCHLDATLHVMSDGKLHRNVSGNRAHLSGVERR
jgi:hypothetical protein